MPVSLSISANICDNLITNRSLQINWDLPVRWSLIRIPRVTTLQRLAALSCTFLQGGFWGVSNNEIMTHQKTEKGGNLCEKKIWDQTARKWCILLFDGRLSTIKNRSNYVQTIRIGFYSFWTSNLKKVEC